MEYVRCNLCQSDQPERLFVTRDWNERREPSEFNVVRCRRCRLVYLNPRPTHSVAGDYYEDFYSAGHGSATEINSAARLDRTGRYQLDKAAKITSLRSQGRILDVGCGTGEFLALLRERGWEVWGVEISENAVRFARAAFGLDVFLGQVWDAHFPDGYFDVVTLYGVLAYMADPLRCLIEIRGVLADDGMVVVASPNLDSLQARVFGNRWYHLNVPRHAYFFSLETLSLMLRAAGFEPFRIDHFCGYHSPAGITESLINMLNIRVELTPRGMPVGQRQAGQHGQRTFARRMLRAVVDLLAGTASYLESSLGYGAHPTIYATKGSSG